MSKHLSSVQMNFERTWLTCNLSRIAMRYLSLNQVWSQLKSSSRRRKTASRLLESNLRMALTANRTARSSVALGPIRYSYNRTRTTAYTTQPTFVQSINQSVTKSLQRPIDSPYPLPYKQHHQYIYATSLIHRTDIARPLSAKDLGIWL